MQSSLRQPHRRRLPSLFIPAATLVNTKLKWIKDRSLDFVVSRERHLRLAHKSLFLLPHNPSAAKEFLRRFPALLSPAAVALRKAEIETVNSVENDLVGRVRRLLMMTRQRALPIHTVDQLSWDFGLPWDYEETLVRKFPDFFRVFRPDGDERVWVGLVEWDAELAVSELEKRYAGQNCEKSGCMAFPIRFARGFGLKKKCVQWLNEWQTLPYTSPYVDSSGLDPRTDVAEKRNVGVFHELLHLTIAKKTERANVSNLRKALGLSQKFTKVFERHPGIFYLSEKMGKQTVVLREAYGGGRELLVKHPIQEIREKYIALLRASLPKRKRRSVKEVEDTESEVENIGCSDTESEAGI